MDAVVPQDVRNAAYGQAVWFWLPDAGVKSADFRIGRRWWLTSPALRREREVSRKPLRRECRSVSAYLYDLWAPFFSAHEACGCGQRPAFPAPSCFGGRS